MGMTSLQVRKFDTFKKTDASSVPGESSENWDCRDLVRRADKVIRAGVQKILEFPTKTKTASADDTLHRPASISLSAAGVGNVSAIQHHEKCSGDTAHAEEHNWQAKNPRSPFRYDSLSPKAFTSYWKQR